VLQLVDSLHLLDLVKDTNAENLILEAHKAAALLSSDMSMDQKMEVSVGRPSPPTPSAG
jgi:hypothetical protein